jgi:hypothetical protein
VCQTLAAELLSQVIFVLRDIRLGEEEVGLLHLFRLLRVVLHFGYSLQMIPGLGFLFQKLQGIGEA